MKKTNKKLRTVFRIDIVIMGMLYRVIEKEGKFFVECRDTNGFETREWPEPSYETESGAYYGLLLNIKKDNK